MKLFALLIILKSLLTNSNQEGFFLSDIENEKETHKIIIEKQTLDPNFPTQEYILKDENGTKIKIETTNIIEDSTHLDVDDSNER